MIFIQALRKNDINPNGGKQVEFGKAFFETFNWEANTVHEIKIHVGSDVITTSLKVRGSQRGGDREGVDCKEYANDQGKFPLKDYFIEKMKLTPEHVGKVYLIFVPLKNDGSEFELSVTPFKNKVTPHAGSYSDFPLQQIFYGAPGTGKSFRIKRDTANQSKIRTTFHPDSDYSTFVGCYKPTMSNEGDRADQEKGGGTKQIEYAFVAQAFLKAYVKAWKYYCSKGSENAKLQYLIIEEINRGNCAQIFGDLFQLLDRNEDGYSTYPIVADTDIQKYLSKEFEELDVPDSLNMIYDDYDGNVAEDIKNGTVLALPNNFYIWATMNTSDQSLFPIDSAFKRRWDWKYMPIDTKKENWNIEVDGNKYSWTVFLEKVNEQIFEVTKSEDKKLGFYFCRANNNVVGAEKFVSKVIFYLYNDVFKDYGYDRKMFKDENGKAIQFHEYFQCNGDINEQKAALFLDNLEVKPIGENKEE
ncbi:AAA family ATPase [Segatella copri]|uniref:AAA family ATPase n=1 Tax=Segatella copri TaxID=165179 RepID=UPI001EE3BEE9|nr:AAA family ATPase [Segatella copri]